MIPESGFEPTAETNETPHLLPKRMATRTSSGLSSVRLSGVAVAKYIVLTVYAAITLFPLLWVVSNSFRTTNQILTGIRLLPESFSMVNYERVLMSTSIPRAFMNSLTIDGVSIALLLAVVLPLSFVLARFRFRFGVFIYLFFSLAVLVPAVTVLPMTFKLFSDLQLLGHKYAIAYIYVVRQMPLSVFLMVMFMRTIPAELDEAAIIDGCGTWGLFWNVILPLSRNGTVTVVILSFVAIWNDYLTALVILTRPIDKTLSVVLSYARTEYSVDYGMLSAAIVFAIAPMIVMYVLLKDNLIQGMAMGAVKG